MGLYTYQGVDRAGKKVNGQLEVNSEGELRMQLRQQGVRPVRIIKPGAISQDLGQLFRSGDTISTQVIVTFTRQLQVLISAGIPVTQSLEILADQSIDKSSKRIFLSLQEKVSTGMFLWEALATFPKAFPKMYVALIRAGESSGSMDSMLKRLSRYIENADKLRKTVKGAMMYPAIVMSIGIGVIALMLVFVIPKFEEMIKSNGGELPGPTQFVINLSHFMVNNILYILGALVATIILLIRFYRTTEGRALVDRVLFRMPIFGNLLQKSGVARFARTMQTLLSSGVNLIDAIDICKATINNAVLEDAVGKIRAEIEAGRTLGQVIGRLPVFPKMACQMISVGEQTGALDKMLDKIADFYEEEVEALVAGMTKLIEPFILVFLGGTVGGLMIAMYLPIFKLGESAGGG